MEVYSLLKSLSDGHTYKYKYMVTGRHTYTWVYETCSVLRYLRRVCPISRSCRMSLYNEPNQHYNLNKVSLFICFASYAHKYIKWMCPLSLGSNYHGCGYCTMLDPISLCLILLERLVKFISKWPFCVKSDRKSSDFILK